MAEIRYTKDHEWLRLEEDGVATVGITDHAQQALGDVVFVELPDEGRALDEHEACAVVESVKAASDVYAPLAGVVVAANAALADDPSLVNREPHEGAWFFRIKLTDPAAFESLMDADAYKNFCDTH